MGRKPLKKNLCVDCQKYALKERDDYFIVNNSLWREHGVGKGLLCWNCFELRMGRSFVKSDFWPCNANKQNKRIRRLKDGD